MGSEGKLGLKKLRKMEEVFGERLYMAFATRDSYIVGVTPDDRHLYWHRRSGEVGVDQSPIHWTSCPSARQKWAVSDWLDVNDPDRASVNITARVLGAKLAERFDRRNSVPDSRSEDNASGSGSDRTEESS